VVVIGSPSSCVHGPAIVAQPRAPDRTAMAGTEFRPP
jgi:hypothetical protein